MTALMVAVEKGNIEIVKLLLSNYRTDVNILSIWINWFKSSFPSKF